MSLRRRGQERDGRDLLDVRHVVDGELGSQLFEAICLLPEYYLTRAENEILQRYSDEIVASVDGQKTLVEMGSGSASKTRLVIEALLRIQPELLFMPVDISATALESSSRILLQSYPRLRIEAYAADYFAGLAELGKKPRARTLALFLGSNISNFDREEALRFLRAMRSVLQKGDALLLGADLKKDPAVLEAAYNDALGVTFQNSVRWLNRLFSEKNEELANVPEVTTLFWSTVTSNGTMPPVDCGDVPGPELRTCQFMYERT